MKSYFSSLVLPVGEKFAQSLQNQEFLSTRSEGNTVCCNGKLDLHSARPWRPWRFQEALHWMGTSQVLNKNRRTLLTELNLEIRMLSPVATNPRRLKKNLKFSLLNYLQIKLFISLWPTGAASVPTCLIV